MAEENFVPGNRSFDLQSRAVLRELQHTLYQIARRSELGTHSAASIQADAESALRLIDSFMMSAQAEYGQLELSLEPLTIGSVLHEVAHDARLLKSRREILINDRAHHPVMTNRLALRSMLVAAADILQDVSQNNNSVELRSYVQKDGRAAVGVFTENDTLSQADLDRALALQGGSHMALPRHSNSSGVSVIIADMLARTLGGSLQVKRMGCLRGLSTTLPRSEQLALV